MYEQVAKVAQPPKPASDAKLRAFRRTTAIANMARDSSIQCPFWSMIVSTSFKCSASRVPDVDASPRRR
jgi:hypothetical protein